MHAINEDDRRILGDYGVITNSVKHLGVQISADYSEGRALTYADGKTAMAKSMSRITSTISNTNLLLKAQSVNTIIGSINNHRYRVYPPNQKETEDCWKNIKKTMWTHTYLGNTSVRHKISQENVTRPVTQGGLAIIHPERSAITCLVSSLAGIVHHAKKHSLSILNVVENPMRSAWADRLAVVNGKNIGKIFSNFRNIFPPQSKSIICSLPEIFTKLELDEVLALSAPTFEHHLEPDRFMFNTPLQFERLRRPNDEEMFSTVASLCLRDETQKSAYDITINSRRLDALAESEGKARLIQLREKLCTRFGNRSKQPFFFKASSQNKLTETWGVRLPSCFREINKGIKRIFKRTAWLDQPSKYLPPSFFTRERDGISLPPHRESYIKAYLPLTYSEMPAITRSFHLEYLNRTLISRTKLESMKVSRVNSYCNHCSKPASSIHVLNDCILAQIVRRTFIHFFKEKKMNQALLQTDSFHDYFWWDPATMNNQLHRELWLVWVETRRHAHSIDFLQRFERFGVYQFTAKAITAFRKAAEAAKILKFPRALELCKFALDHHEDFTRWYTIIQSHLDRRRR